MIEIKGLPTYIVNPEVEKVLSTHINQMLRHCVVFIGALTEEGKKSKFWKKDERKELRKRICPIYVEDDAKRKELILSLIRKLYSSEIETLTVNEKFILTKACDAAISNEERVISALVKEDDMQLENWMWGRYMIEDTDERRKVLAHLEEREVGVNEYPEKILEEYPIKERNRILDVIGQTNMLLFEYPTAINLVFNSQEYEMLTGVQITDE